MKKTISVVLILTLLFSFASCAKKTPAPDTKPAAGTGTEPGSLLLSGTPELYNPKNYDEISGLLKITEYPSDGFVTNSGIAVDDAEVALPESSMESIPPVSENESAMKGDYSDTNVQVEGFDESDIIKTDGKYIYILKDSCKLVILKADGIGTYVVSESVICGNDESKYKDKEYTNPEEYHYVSRGNNAVEMYVSGNVLSVIISEYEYEDSFYEGVYSYKNLNRTTVRFYDVSVPENPVLTNEFSQDGYYVSGRMNDGNIYIVSSYYPDTYFGTDEGGVVPYTYINGEMTIMPVDSIYCPREDRVNRTYTVISKYASDGSTALDHLAFLGLGNTVYMNASGLYIVGTRYTEKSSPEYTDSIYSVVDYVTGQVTDVTKISTEGEMIPVATATVPGNIINQFVLDEYNGYLRIVTTVSSNSYSIYTDKERDFVNYKWNENGTTNSLYVLDSSLNVTGSITGLAEDERVYSVRFSGDVGYFVTFRQTDPLFAVDLSDPANPKITSELKIPGFSEYLHPFSNGLLLGLGRNADPETGRQGELKLSMFDTSNPFDVTEIASSPISDVYYSSAEYNHKAVFVSSERGLIGLPSGMSYLMYRWTGTAFELVKEIELTDMYWWAEARGLYIGNYFYAVSNNTTAVLDFDSLTQISTINY